MAAWATAAVLASLGVAAVAGVALAADQHVGGTVEPQFGVAVAPDGTIAGNSSTIAVKVTRTVVNGVPVITITPRD